MHVIHGAQAPQFELPGVRFTALAAPSRGSAQVCAWEITVDGDLVSPVPHSLDHDELFIVTQGAIRLRPDAPVAGPGDVAVAPAGSQIQLVNTSAEPARAFVVIQAGFKATDADGAPVDPPPWAQ